MRTVLIRRRRIWVVQAIAVCQPPPVIAKPVLACNESLILEEANRRPGRAGIPRDADSKVLQPHHAGKVVVYQRCYLNQERSGRHVTNRLSRSPFHRRHVHVVPRRGDRVPWFIAFSPRGCCSYFEPRGAQNPLNALFSGRTLCDAAKLKTAFQGCFRLPGAVRSRRVSFGRPGSGRGQNGPLRLPWH